MKRLPNWLASLDNCVAFCDMNPLTSNAAWWYFASWWASCWPTIFVGALHLSGIFRSGMTKTNSDSGRIGSGWTLMSGFSGPGWEQLPWIRSGRVGVKNCRGVPVRGENFCLEIGSSRVGIKSCRGVPVRGEKKFAPQGTTLNHNAECTNTQCSNYHMHACTYACSFSPVHVRFP